MKKNNIVLSLISSALMSVGVAQAQKGETTYRSAKENKFEIYPVKYSKSETQECLDFKGGCLLPLSKKPSLVLQNFKYSPLESGQPGIKLILSDKVSKEFEKLTRKHLNNRLAFMYQGNVVLAPTVKSVIKSHEFTVTFRNQEVFQNILQSIDQDQETN